MFNFQFSWALLFVLSQILASIRFIAQICPKRAIILWFQFVNLRSSNKATNNNIRNQLRVLRGLQLVIFLPKPLRNRRRIWKQLKVFLEKNQKETTSNTWKCSMLRASITGGRKWPFVSWGFPYDWNPSDPKRARFVATTMNLINEPDR